MKRVFRIILPVFLFVAAMLFAASLPLPRIAHAVQPLSDAQPAVESQSVVNAQLVSARCVGCHGLDRTCSKFGQKDQAAWLRTVKRMVEVRGTDISPASVEAFAAYLMAPDAELLQMCGK